MPLPPPPPKQISLNSSILPVSSPTLPSFVSHQPTEPFFTVIRFFLSTAFNTMAKKKQVALARKEALRKGGNGSGAGGSGKASAGEKDLGDADIRSKAAGGSR